MTIRVKQLEWADSYGVMRAETPFGTYMARGNILTFNRIDSIGPDPMGRAQADFERRILSVIEEDRDGAKHPSAKLQRSLSEALKETVSIDPSDRDEVLEQAARVCDDEEGVISHAGEHRNIVMRQDALREAAAAIRAMKGGEQ